MDQPPKSKVEELDAVKKRIAELEAKRARAQQARAATPPAPPSQPASQVESPQNLEGEATPEVWTDEEEIKLIEVQRKTDALNRMEKKINDALRKEVGEIAEIIEERRDHQEGRLVLDQNEKYNLENYPDNYLYYINNIDSLPEGRRQRIQSARSKLQIINRKYNDLRRGRGIHYSQTSHLYDEQRELFKKRREAKKFNDPWSDATYYLSGDEQNSVTDIEDRLGVSPAVAIVLKDQLGFRRREMEAEEGEDMIAPPVIPALTTTPTPIFRPLPPLPPISTTGPTAPPLPSPATGPAQPKRKIITKERVKKTAGIGAALAAAFGIYKNTDRIIRTADDIHDWWTKDAISGPAVSGPSTPERATTSIPQRIQPPPEAAPSAETGKPEAQTAEKTETAEVKKEEVREAPVYTFEPPAPEPTPSPEPRAEPTPPTREREVAAARERVERAFKATLSEAELEEVYEVYEEALQRLFPGAKAALWQQAKIIPALNVFYHQGRPVAPTDTVPEFMHKLREMTGLEPEGTMMKPENIYSYIERNLKVIAQGGQLDEIRAYIRDPNNLRPRQ